MFNLTLYFPITFTYLATLEHSLVPAIAAANAANALVFVCLFNSFAQESTASLAFANSAICLCISSNFSRVIDFKGMIFGLHKILWWPRRWRFQYQDGLLGRKKNGDQESKREWNLPRLAYASQKKQVQTLEGPLAALPVPAFHDFQDRFQSRAKVGSLKQKQNQTKKVVERGKDKDGNTSVTR